ncbi:MAG: hypothetical protein Q4B40_06350 [Clostridia bacterium]|nr:hypothetical protein [Clostridia bacterium]
MKTKIFVLSIVLMLLCSFCVMAHDVEYNISVPNDFTVVHKGDNVDTVANQLNLDKNTLNEYFTKRGTVYLAVSSDGKTQVRLSIYNDNFSSEVGDMSRLDQTGIDEFAVAVGGNNDAKIIKNNDRKFIVIKNTLKDSGGIYTVTQYVTIANDKTYYLSCYNDGEQTSQEITDIFKSFSIETPEIIVPDFTTQKILIYIGIVIFSGIAVIMLISIIKSKFKSNEKESNDE